MTAGDAESEIRDLLARFDRAFAAGDADALAELFATDARLLLLHREAVEGQAAIRDVWSRAFAEHDTSAWSAEHWIEGIHGDRAYTVSVYTETLVERRADASIDVWGRFICFCIRGPDGSWRITLVMNSHSRPNERRVIGDTR